MNGPIDSLIGLDVIDAIVPTDGLLVALAEVFIDESGTHAGSPVMCVGGYLFRKREAREFQREWGKRLAREGLAYWHTNPAMQGHGEAPFSPEEEWPDSRRDKLQRALIKRVRRQASYGFAITVNEDEYNEIMPKHPDLGSAYSFCLRHCLVAVRSWCDRVGFDGKITYEFEAGHADAAQAGEIMRRVFAEDRLRETYRYGRHGFSDKRLVHALQAADLIAWHWRTNAVHRRNGRAEPRKDTVALLEDPADVKVMAWTAERLTEMAGLLQAGKLRTIL